WRAQVFPPRREDVEGDEVQHADGEYDQRDEDEEERDVGDDLLIALRGGEELQVLADEPVETEQDQRGEQRKDDARGPSHEVLLPRRARISRTISRTPTMRCSTPIPDTNPRTKGLSAHIPITRLLCRSEFRLQMRV